MLYLDGVESNFGILHGLDEVAHHATALFPSDTNLTCTLTAAATANTFSSYTEIVDSGATTLSTAFAGYKGHITSMIVESVSEDDTLYEMEISYGASHTIIGRWRFAGATKFLSPVHQLRVQADDIPAGETVYYRLKTETAVADTATVHFRYFLHS